MGEFCCGCDNEDESACMAWDAQSCSREAWRGLPGLFVNTFLYYQEDCSGELTFSYISDNTRLAQGHQLSWEPSKDQLPVHLPFEPMFWKGFWESQEKWKPPTPAPWLFPEKMPAEAGKSRSQELCIFGGRERKRPVFRQLGDVK